MRVVSFFCVSMRVESSKALARPKQTPLRVELSPAQERSNYLC